MQIKSVKNKNLPFDPTILGIYPRVIKVKDMYIKLALRLLITTLLMAGKKEIKAHQYNIK